MAARNIISLNTTPQLLAPQTGDTYSAPRALAITPETLTGSAATTGVSVTYTWNTSGTPTAILADITDTASNAASLLLDLKVGGASKMRVAKDGAVKTAAEFDAMDGANIGGSFSIYGHNLNQYAEITFSNSDFSGATRDIKITRKGAGVLKITDGSTGASGFNLTSVTVASLPTAVGATNTIFLVSDALAPVKGATVAGGGAVLQLVVSDNTNWKVL